MALVSHDYNIKDEAGFFDYSPYAERIHRLADEQACDTVLYALFTWDVESLVPRGPAFFDGLSSVQLIILEVGYPPDEGQHVEVWQRGAEAPMVAHQRFASSSDPRTGKQAFIDDLPGRRIGDALLMLCGESNIVSTQRGSEEFFDPFGFAGLLDGVRLVLNPIHDYMRRHEMRKKRCFCSRGGRTVISVWNQGKGSESALPWTVFRDGEECTADVAEVPTPFPERPDIRIGVFDTRG